MIGQKMKSSIDYTAAIARLETAVRDRMAEHGLHGLSLALVDGPAIVHAAAFGNVRRESLFRAGSISKLFNALAVMQQVERGKIDLDAPITSYGRQFESIVPFAGAAPVTVRQLLCHRSGIVRESPVGGYFDASQPGLAQMVASLRDCVLVNPPNTKTSYSNAATSVAGQIVATVSGCPFAEYQREHLLGPLGMASSSFVLAGIERQRLAEAHMRAADGRGGLVEIPAPVFDLGTIPAGNLFSTAEDLARMVCMLADEGRARGAQIVRPATLAQMWTPQLTGEDAGYGLGFMVERLAARNLIPPAFRRHTVVSHSGAVYGHSTALVYLPESKLGVVILCDEDNCAGIVRSLCDRALGLMLEAKFGEDAPMPDPIVATPAATLAALAGNYESASTWAEFTVEEASAAGMAKTACLAGKLAGLPVRLLPIGPSRFFVNGRMAYGATITFQTGEAGKPSSFVTSAGDRFERIAPVAPSTPPLWESYVGSYGPSFIPLVISLRNGRLFAMTENLADYRLTPVNRTVFAMPAGLYTDEHLVFHLGADGKPWAAELAGMMLPRNEAGPSLQNRSGVEAK